MHEGNRFAEDGPRGSAILRALRQAAIWIAVGAGLYGIVTGLFDLPGKPPPSVARTAPPRAAPPPIRNSLVYRADRNGHVIVDGHVNGTGVRFLVDTGATLVTLAPGDAAAVGLDPGRPGEFRQLALEPAPNSRRLR